MKFQSALCPNVREKNLKFFQKIIAHPLILTGGGILFLSGCAQYGALQGFPKPGYDVKGRVRELTEYVNTQNTNLDAILTVEGRNEYIAHRIALADLEYYKLIRTVTGVKNGLDAGKEIAVGSMGAAGAIVGGGSAQILSAAVAATTAANAGIDKVYFYNQTMPAIISAMNAGRNIVLGEIADKKERHVNGVGPTINDYTAQEADSDLNRYYFAGTFVGAADTIQKSSSETSNNADKIKASSPLAANANAKVKAGTPVSKLLPEEQSALRLRKMIE